MRKIYDFMSEKLGEDLIIKSAMDLSGGTIVRGEYLGQDFYVSINQSEEDVDSKIRFTLNENSGNMHALCMCLQEYLGDLDPVCAYEACAKNSNNVIFGIEWSKYHADIILDQVNNNKLMQPSKIIKVYENFSLSKDVCLSYKKSEN